VLLLSFTTDLGFFETVGLGVAQVCGARVTVVADAAMGAADPRAVRRAGRSYLPGYAVCGGAFHPKLVAVVSPHRAAVAIGSGDATLAEWQANAELWTVLRADWEHFCAVYVSSIAAPSRCTMRVAVAMAPWSGAYTTVSSSAPTTTVAWAEGGPAADAGCHRRGGAQRAQAKPAVR